ncbi:hypothetical protein [Loktanella sp. S4079]|uniref:hypothetical protein n=1 Tax=Loktanella sp. S4079 TaxID=579483 RepID=UPI0005F9E1B9|nr:hypothetical protein [Loktanella sp. S4079]KJZ17129.1 hypothetical protein TW80_17350 [Loktanella sp. S4079]
MLRTLPTNLSIDSQHAAVSAHLAQHGAALCNAAYLLQGQVGEARVLRILSDLRTTTRLERATRRRLVDLHRLISLDPVFGDSETESGLWQFLDPGSRDVEEICLLADRLFDLLVEIGELDDEVGAFAVAVEGLDAA